MTVQANSCQTMPSQVSPMIGQPIGVPPAVTGDHRQREPDDRDDGDDGAGDVTGDGHSRGQHQAPPRDAVQQQQDQDSDADERTGPTARDRQRPRVRRGLGPIVMLGRRRPWS